MPELTRRAFVGAVGLAALAVLTGCETRDEPAGNTDVTPAPEATPDTTPSARPGTGANILLAYFSRPGENYWEGGRRDLAVGNTKRLAMMISERIACDVYEIVAADAYPWDYDLTVRRNVAKQEDDARPAIAGKLPDVSAYSTVLIGSPVWNVRAPMIMSTFVEGVDLEGKRVLPFVTYAVSGMAGVDQDYRDALPGSAVADGLAVRGEDVNDAAPDLESWLRANGLL